MRSDALGMTDLRKLSVLIVPAASESGVVYLVSFFKHDLMYYLFLFHTPQLRSMFPKQALIHPPSPCYDEIPLPIADMHTRHASH
jgi:hypothetical protein